MTKILEQAMKSSEDVKDLITMTEVIQLIAQGKSVGINWKHGGNGTAYESTGFNLSENSERVVAGMLLVTAGTRLVLQGLDEGEVDLDSLKAFNEFAGVAYEATEFLTEHAEDIKNGNPPQETPQVNPIEELFKRAEGHVTIEKDENGNADLDQAEKDLRKKAIDEIGNVFGQLDDETKKDLLDSILGK